MPKNSGIKRYFPAGRSNQGEYSMDQTPRSTIVLLGDERFKTPRKKISYKRHGCRELETFLKHRSISSEIRKPQILPENTIFGAALWSCFGTVTKGYGDQIGY